ncbi:unnamed protein product [Durusdinium trenchii]|uniref:Thioredoxin domain-containing protein n=2 Tax=Durusdinium trenchii TaxID=1381693 RepID=A0ABP0JRX5_9DINO
MEDPAFDWSSLIGEDLLLCKSALKEETKEQKGITHLDDKLCSIRTSQALPKSLKLVLLYFSGRWCPVCTEFDNIMRDVYTALQSFPEHSDIEFVWISCDLSEDSYKAHLKRLGVLSGATWSPKRLQEAAARWDLKALPSLLVMDALDGRVVTANARRDVEDAYDDEQHGANKGYLGLLLRWLELLDEQRAALDDGLPMRSESGIQGDTAGQSAGKGESSEFA